jgi:hypothetical protein
MRVLERANAIAQELERSLIYDSDTDTVIKDSDPGDNPPPRDEDWRERGGKGTYDEANFSVPELPPVTPPEQSPDESDRPRSRGPATRYDEIALDQLSKAGFTGKDLGNAGIRVTHRLGAENGLTTREFLDMISEMSDAEVRGMVDKAVLDLTTTDREGNAKFDFGREYMQELYAPRPDSSTFYGLPEKPASAPTLSSWMGPYWQSEHGYTPYVPYSVQEKFGYEPGGGVAPPPSYFDDYFARHPTVQPPRFDDEYAERKRTEDRDSYLGDYFARHGLGKTEGRYDDYAARHPETMDWFSPSSRDKNYVFDSLTTAEWQRLQEHIGEEGEPAIGANSQRSWDGLPRNTR